MPAVNWILMIAAIGLVLAFRSSGNLAAAYGVAVNSTMAITTVLAFKVARERGGWSLPAALGIPARRSWHRPGISRIQPAQDSGWRLAAVVDRCGIVHRHDDVAPRGSHSGRTNREQHHESGDIHRARDQRAASRASPAARYFSPAAWSRRRRRCRNWSGTPASCTKT